MSIKGTSQELYVGKKESNIISFAGNKKKIDYDDLKRIDYMYAAFGELGYIDFVHNNNKADRFEFNKKANEKILRTVELIQENNDGINIVEKRAEDLKFYERWWFIILSMFFCCAPIGLFLIWYKRKSTLNNRIFFTIMALILCGTWYYVPYNNYKSSMNQVNEAMADYQNNINGIQSSSDQSKKKSSNMTETAKEKIEYASYSVADMVADLNSNALNASEKYKDQYVEITGKLRNIDSDGKYISLDPDDEEFNLIGIQCNIKDDDQKDKVSGMTIGQSVTLKGKVTSVGEVLGYSLDIDEIN